MTMIRSSAAIESCRRHIDTMVKPDPEIEAVLCAYVCSVIYAELEAMVVTEVANRASHQNSDKWIKSWAGVSARRLIRSIKISELAGVAGHFDPECKDAFSSGLDPVAVAAWNQIVNNRHAVAHESDGTASISTMTFSEAEVAFEKVELVLACFAAALHSANDHGSR